MEMRRAERIVWVLLVLLLGWRAFGADSNSAQRLLEVVRLKVVTTGGEGAAIEGGVQYNTTTDQVIISDGATWFNACD